MKSTNALPSFLILMTLLGACIPAGITPLSSEEQCRILNKKRTGQTETFRSLSAKRHVKITGRRLRPSQSPEMNFGASALRTYQFELTTGEIVRLEFSFVDDNAVYGRYGNYNYTYSIPLNKIRRIWSR